MNTHPHHHAPRPLLVGLNGRFSGTLRPTGTQVASFHLFDAIIRRERDFPVVIFADGKFPGTEAWRTIPQTRFVDVPFSRWRRSAAQLWEQLVLPIRAAKAGCTLLHHPMTTCPRWRNGIRQIVTVHDLNFFHHPEWVSRAFRCWLSAVAVPAIKRADHVATISDYVLDDVRRTLGIAAAKSSRIYNGLTPLPASHARPAHDATARVILGVNLWQPHKNLSRLIEAFSRLRTEVPALELHLAGRPQANHRTQPELAGLLARPGVRVLGYTARRIWVRLTQMRMSSAIPRSRKASGSPCSKRWRPAHPWSHPTRRACPRSPAVPQCSWIRSPKTASPPASGRC